MKKTMSLIIFALATLSASCQSLVPAYSNVEIGVQLI